MIKIHINLILLILSNFCFSQTNQFDESFKKSHLSIILMENDCEKVVDLIKADIKNNSIFILLQGGIVPIRYSDDSDFEKKYNILFYEQGCVGSQCAEFYNFLIFDYLYKTYGKKWIKEIRKDAIGFKEWKKQL